jgi:hypothetical protein
MFPTASAELCMGYVGNYKQLTTALVPRPVKEESTTFALPSPRTSWALEPSNKPGHIPNEKQVAPGLNFLMFPPLGLPSPMWFPFAGVWALEPITHTKNDINYSSPFQPGCLGSWQKH